MIQMNIDADKLAAWGSLLYQITPPGGHVKAVTSFRINHHSFTFEFEEDKPEDPAMPDLQSEKDTPASVAHANADITVKPEPQPEKESSTVPIARSDADVTETPKLPSEENTDGTVPPVTYALIQRLVELKPDNVDEVNSAIDIHRGPTLLFHTHINMKPGTLMPNQRNENVINPQEDKIGTRPKN